MSFNAVNEYVLAFLTSQVENGNSTASILESWKTQEDGLKTLLENENDKIKKKKDKNAPKGAKSAYIIFCADERPKVKEEEPGMETKKIAAELGKRWKELKEDDEEKVKEYQKMAEADKVRFKTEMENYVPGEEVEKGNKKTKKTKDKNAPNGAKSAYILFCSDERPQVKEDMPNIDSKEVLAELGKRWKALKDNDEDRYNEFQVMAEKDKVRFKNEMKNYVPVESDTEDEDKVKNKDKDTPKRSKTAYQMFCEEQKETVKQDGFEGKEVVAELARRWKDLESEDEDYFKNLKTRAEKLKKEFQVANPVEEKEKRIKKDDKKDKDEKKVEKDDKVNDDKKVVTKVKVAKKKTNEQIVSDILDSFEDETCTMRMIRKKLEEMEITIDKKELKEIVDKYNEDN